MATTDRKSFTARLPPDLHQALLKKQEALPDVTMNDLVILGIRHVVEGEELTVITDSEMTDAREDLVVASIDGDVGALKGTAQHFANLGRTNLSSLLYWAAAEVIGQSDAKQAARELLRTADAVQHRGPVAIALLRAALRLNPSNEVIKNRLGQLLYFEGDYGGAVEHLAPVRDRDNRARLFHGWASLKLAKVEGNRAALSRSRDEVVRALETWAFGERDPRQRSSWLRQVRQLNEEGPDYTQAVRELIAYANENTSWKPISESEVTDPGEGDSR